MFLSFNVNSACMDFMVEGKRGLLPSGFKCWLLQFIQDLAYTCKSSLQQSSEIFISNACSNNNTTFIHTEIKIRKKA